MKYFVSRQNYFGVEEDENLMVEVAIGGTDYANADMLGVKWPHLGEGTEYNDPREAVEAAIAICEEWKKTEPSAQVGMGATMGFTVPFEGETYDDLRKKAERLYENLPKCAQCGELLGKDTYTHVDAMDDEKFCSTFCAEKHFVEMNTTDEQEEDDDSSVQD